ncbi:MAG: T9SS type A sorting domain-containing protein [Bacteroidales bacterium]|nr:T9SS type A sorting domain-containing protein [Bacteroidales bacterium]
MKRILFFSLLISFTFHLNAQSFGITYNGNAVANGDTVTIVSTEEEFQFRPAFTNNSNSDVVARVTAEKLNNSEIEVSAICTDHCVPGNISYPFALPKDSTYNSIYIDFDLPQNSSEGIFKISIYDTVKTSTRSDFYVKIRRGNAGIAQIDCNSTLRLYPNPATKSVNVEYSISSDNGTLVIYSLTGVVVREKVLNSRQGNVSINVSDLPAGVYFYGIRSKNWNSPIRKLVIR